MSFWWLLNDEVLNNEDINDDAEEGDDDDAGEDQPINSAVNILLYKYKVAYYRMVNFCERKWDSNSKTREESEKIIPKDAF